MPVQSVTVNPDGTGGYVTPGMRDLTHPDACHPYGYPLMMAAGLAAEELFWSDPDVAWDHAAGDRRHLYDFGHTDTEILAWCREARALIEAQRPAWARLASVLSGGGTFTGETARRVLAGRTEPSDVRAMAAGLELRKAVPA
jgi:hypothetical protein